MKLLQTPFPLALALSLFLFQPSLRADHIAGGGITYCSLGGQRYLFKVNIFRDCAGESMKIFSTALTAYCGASGQTIQFFLPLKKYKPSPGGTPAGNDGRIVSNFCHPDSLKCRNGTQSGYAEYLYEGEVILPPCTNWEITYKPGCCRNALNNNSATGMQFSAIINNQIFPSNCAPQFDQRPHPVTIVCTGSAVRIALGGNDPDGDSLRYTLTSVRNANGTAAAYYSGYSQYVPMTNASLDPLTGDFYAVAQASGHYQIAYMVEDYERCDPARKGQRKSIHYREIQVSASPCQNQTPYTTGFSVLSGGFMVSPFVVEMCEGTAISWTDTIIDPDQGASPTLLTDIPDKLPGAVISQTSLPNGKRLIQTTWTASPGIHTFLVGGTDSVCPRPGISLKTYTLRVRASANSGSDRIVCRGDGTRLLAKGGTSFTWRTVSGTPLITGVNWFPVAGTQGAEALFIPNMTTRLEVTSNGITPCAPHQRSCATTDTVLITVADSFSIRTTPDFKACQPGSGVLEVFPSNSSFSYKYFWTNPLTGFLDSNRQANFSQLVRPSHFVVRVTSAQGCVRTDSVFVDLTAPFPHGSQITPIADNAICQSDTLTLGLQWGSALQGATCDTLTGGCTSTLPHVNIVRGVIKNPRLNPDYPVIFGAFHNSMKAQMIYRGKDLHNRGLRAGSIASIAFEIDSLSSAGRTNFHEFVIKAGCSSIEKFDPGPGSAFVPSTQLDTVFTSKTITPDVGWNTLAFDHRFNWDGHSDLIIEVTFYNPTYASDNPVMKFSTVNYLATNYTYMRGSQFIASREVVGSSQYPTAMLPNTRFSLCANSNIANYDYLWYSTHGNGTFLSPNNNDTMRVALDRQHDSLFKLVLIDRQAPQCRDTLSKQFFVFDGPFPVHPDTATFCDPDNNLPLRNWVFGRNLVLPFGVWRGTGIVDSILGIWDPKVSGLGKFMVSYGSPLSVCAHRDSITLHIRPSAQVFPKIVCKGDRHPLHSAQPFKWVQGAYIDSMWQAPQMQYFLHPNQTLPKKVMRSYYENSFGCYHHQQDSVEIIDSLYFLGEYYEGRIQHFTEMCYNQSEQLYSSIPAHWHHTALPGLITDSGWIDMSKLNLNMGDTQFVEIGMTNAACLDTAKFNILALRPPEMEIITKEYCKREFICGGLVGSEQHDTLRLWIRKQAPLQHLKDTIFHLPSHNGLWWRIDISGHSINGWRPSPNPLSIQSPQLGRFRWCDKREDSIEVSFHLNLLLDNPKRCRHADTGILYFRNTDTLQSPTITKSICGKDTVMLYAPTYGGWTRYKWSDGSTGKSLITDYSGTISVYTELVKGCYQEQKFDVTRCLGEVENTATTSIQLYPVPTPGILHLRLAEPPENEIQFRLLHAQGAEVRRGTAMPSHTYGEFDISMVDLSPGVYILTLWWNNENHNFRIVVR